MFRAELVDCYRIWQIKSIINSCGLSYALWDWNNKAHVHVEWVLILIIFLKYDLCSLVVSYGIIVNFWLDVVIARRQNWLRPN